MENRSLQTFIAETQKNIFVIAYNSGYEIVDFINKYMRSNICEKIDSDYSYWQNQSANRIIEEFLLEEPHIKKTNNQKINIDAVEWLGFFYRRWHFITSESSKQIVRFLPPIDGIRMWYTLHQLDELTTIEMIKRYYNEKRNAYRKCMNKKDPIKPSYDKKSYYAFLAKHMLYKLFKEEMYKNLEYTDDKHYYDFINKEYSLGLKIEVIFSNGTFTIEDALNDANKKAISYNPRMNKSIFFCYTFKIGYEMHIDNFDEEIRQLVSNISSKEIFYDYIYFYILGKVYEINPAKEINVYELSFNKNEREKVEKERRLVEGDSDLL